MDNQISVPLYLTLTKQVEPLGDTWS